jgi:signal transduction histidine kinase
VVEQALQISNRQITHMARLLDDLLDIARITQSKVRLRKELLHLQSALTRAVESSQPLIDSRQHQLDIDLPSAPIYLAADPARLEQILCNLLNNAAKYTDPGGLIDGHNGHETRHNNPVPGDLN